jgi:Eukaryotic initiation factor 4E
MTAALQTPYCFSFVRRGARPSSFKGDEDKKEAPPTTAGYESSIKTIHTVSTVEEFWQIYDFLKRPDSLPVVTDLHIFRGGIKPTWVSAEDDAACLFVHAVMIPVVNSPCAPMLCNRRILQMPRVESGLYVCRKVWLADTGKVSD